jgi:hypothetical protein
VLGHQRAVHRVVGGHHHERARVPDAGLERHQVQLTQHRLGDPRVVGPALGLRVVAHVVLHRRAHPGRLQPGHVAGGDPGGQHRILGEALEPPAERGPHQVDRRGQHHVDALAPRLGAQGGSELADELAVPGGAEGGGAGQAGRGVPVILGDAADSGRPVRHDDRPEPEVVVAVGAPAIAPVSRRTFASTGSAATRLRSSVASVDVVIEFLASRPVRLELGREVQDGDLQVRRVRHRVHVRVGGCRPSRVVAGRDLCPCPAVHQRHHGDLGAR